MKYNYTKTNVKCNSLKFKILKSVIIVSELKAVTFIEPNNLEINFITELSSEEKVELDIIVSIHSDTDVKNYRLYCNVCEEYRCTDDIAPPIICPDPSCGSSDITDVINQENCSELMDENEPFQVEVIPGISVGYGSIRPA